MLIGRAAAVPNAMTFDLNLTIEVLPRSPATLRDDPSLQTREVIPDDVKEFV